MADIAASDVTVTVQKNRIVRGSPGGQQRNIVKVEFGDGALTYPSLGVPLPSFPSFGMRRELEFLVPIDPASASGIIWKYDFENKKLRGYEGDYAQGGDAPLIELDGGVDTPAAQTLYFEAVGW